MAKYLFVCTANIQRSKTAEDYFSMKYPNFEFKSAGTNVKICEQWGTICLTEELLTWADVVFVMETKHKICINNHTNNKYSDKITTLNIADIYQYGEITLIKALESKLESAFKHKP